MPQMYNSWTQETNYLSAEDAAQAMADSAYGGAIHDVIYFDNGEIWVLNYEYRSRVKYCPFTGRCDENFENR